MSEWTVSSLSSHPLVNRRPNSCICLCVEIGLKSLSQKYSHDYVQYSRMVKLVANSWSRPAEIPLSNQKCISLPAKGRTLRVCVYRFPLKVSKSKARSLVGKLCVLILNHTPGRHPGIKVSAQKQPHHILPLQEIRPTEPLLPIDIVEVGFYIGKSTRFIAVYTYMYNS